MTQIILALAALLLILAAVQDVAMLRISNLFPLALIALFGVWAAHIGFSTALWSNALSFLIALGVGTFLFARQWLGGGDVKLLAASALWFPIKGLLPLTVYVTLLGGLLALVFILLRRIVPAGNREGGIPALKAKGPVPYGVAIAAGVIACLYLYGPHPAPASGIPSYMRGSLGLE
ncbi:prepilin peptidase CpaA [Sphingobium faniae]|nr:prepilin peptidase CpaA [Sphingobium faniae]